MAAAPSDAAASSSTAASSSPSAPPSPIASLYTDAFDSVLSFLTLSDLAAAVAASCAWKIVVEDRMPPLRVRILYPQCFKFGMYDSPLTRHIAAIAPRYRHEPSTVLTLTTDMARIISLRLVGLEELCLAMMPSAPVPASALRLPPRLRKLSFSTSHGHHPAATLNAYLVLVGSLTRLESLTLWRRPDEQLCYAPLRGCTALREIDVGFFGDPANNELSAKQIADLRSLCSVEWMRGALMPQRMVQKLTAPPHSLQWTTLKFDHACMIDDSLATQLRSLHTLTRLDGHFEGRSFAWLSSLVRLQVLELSVPHSQADADEFVHSMQACVQMCELRLIGFPTLCGAHLASALSRMHGLTCLSLDRLPQLSSFSFLRSLPLLSSSLTYLRVVFVDAVAVDSLDFEAVHALTALRSLAIAQAGESLVVGAHCRRPSTSVLPHLTSFMINGQSV